jgi:hypothetical protein
MKREEARAAIDKYCARLGPITKANWLAWKPVFSRYITLHYGPSSERWKLIPNTPMPKVWSKASGIKSKRPELIPKSWNDCLHIAEHFGTTDEWYKEFGKKMPLTSAERTELLADLKKYAANCRWKCVMDIKPDASLARLHKRAVGRNGKWGDYKNEILRRCKNLLPPP